MSATASTNFFWSDWLGDQQVRRLSPAERGVWIDLLALAAGGNPVGYVCDANGKPLSLSEINRVVNAVSLEALAELISGILEKGVASRDRTGRIFNRRMVKKMLLSQIRSKIGRNGSDIANAKYRKSKGFPESERQMHRQKGDGEEEDSSLSVFDSPVKIVGASAHARDSMVSEEATSIADELMRLCDIDLAFVPPGWCGAPMRIQGWLNSGWTREFIMIGARRAMANKRDGPPSTVTYFEKPILQEIAAQARPMPTAVVVPFNQEKVYVAGQRSNGILEARDSILEDIKRERRLRTGQSDVDARLLSED